MKKNITVIHTIASLMKSSGVTDAVVYAANGAAIAGHDVKVITWSNDHSIDSNVFHANVEILSLNWLDNFFQRFFLYRKSLLHCVRSLINENSKIIIHDHGLWQESNIAAGWVAKSRDISLIISPHGMLEPWAMAHQGKKKLLAWAIYQKHILKLAKYIHVTAPSEHSNIIKLLPNASICEISLGTNNTNLISTCKSKKALFLSRVHKKKGVNMLVDAWARAAPDNWELLIVGPDEDNHAYNILKLIKKNSLEHTVKIVGPLYEEEKAQILSKCSLFILPSFSENFGLVIAEAFMAGLPVITTNATPWLDLQKRGCGWTISPNVDELAMAIQEATLISEDKRHKMGGIGRKWMLDNFSWDTYGQRMAKLYENVLDVAQPETINT